LFQVERAPSKQALSAAIQAWVRFWLGLSGSQQETDA
jgi:hypothetical protein